MICKVCGKPIDRIDHIVILGGEALCREAVYFDEALMEAMEWFDDCDLGIS